MGVMDTLLNWIAPFLDPMNSFHIYANDMNGVHSNSVKSFQSTMDDWEAQQALQPNVIMSGQWANAVSNLSMDFTQTALDISDMALEVNKLAQITGDFMDCVGDIMEAVGEASAKLADDAVLTDITTDVDIAAVAEGGANPIADIGGLILTLIDGAIILSTIKDLAEHIQQDIQGLVNDLNNLKTITYALIGSPKTTAPEPNHNSVKTPEWKKNPLPDLNSPDLVGPKGLYTLYGSKFSPQQQATFKTVMQQLLQMGLSRDQIADIMDKLFAAGCSPADILLFLQGLLSSDGSKPNSPTPTQIVAKIDSLNNADLKKLVDLYAQIANKDGASRLLERLMTAPFKGGIYDAYMYELQWCVDHKEKIARIEDITLDSRGNNTQAADVVMQGGPFTLGAVVDTKSWVWPISQKRLDGMLEQVAKDQKDYPGYPIVYVFNSSKGDVPANIVEALTKAGVTVMTSPPDRVVGVGDLPQAHTTPMRLAQSVAAVATNAGQQSQQQQLPPQQEPQQQLPPQVQPPQQLPPMEMTQ